MRAYNLKKSLFTIRMQLFIIVLLATGCNGTAGTGSENYPQANTQANEPAVSYGADDQTDPENKTEIRYFFLDGLLVGSWEDGAWRSMNKIAATNSTTYYLKDLLAQESYTLYNQLGKEGTAEQLSWSVGSGLGGFEGKDMTEILAPYSTALADGSSRRKFSLPITLREECADIAVPNYGFYTKFNNLNEIDPNVLLATNSTANLLPGKITSVKSLTDTEILKLKNMLAENEIPAEPYLTAKIQGDLDNDGETESVLAANTPRGENGYPYINQEEVSRGSSSYSIVLFEDNDGTFKTIFSDFRKYENMPQHEGEFWGIDNCHTLDLLGTFDLNSDGRYDICLRYNLWEGGYVFVMALAADDSYQRVMATGYGM